MKSKSTNIVYYRSLFSIWVTLYRISLDPKYFQVAVHMAIFLTICPRFLTSSTSFHVCCRFAFTLKVLHIILLLAACRDWFFYIALPLHNSYTLSFIKMNIILTVPTYAWSKGWLYSTYLNNSDRRFQILLNHNQITISIVSIQRTWIIFHRINLFF